MKKVAAIIITVLMLANVSPVRAEIITIAIEATVSWVNDPCDYLEGNIGPGDIITGTYIYDSTTADSNPSSTVGEYWYYESPFGLSLSAGGFDFKTDPCYVEFLVAIRNNQGITEEDGYILRSLNNIPLSNGALVDDIYWQLNDSSGQALSSIDLLITAPILEDWQDGNWLLIEGEPRVTDFSIQAQVTSVVVVPEPASIIAFGCVFIVLRKHGSKQHRRKH